MSISIVINTETAAEARKQMQELLGPFVMPISETAAQAFREARVSASDELISSTETINTTLAENAAQMDAMHATRGPARVPGQPSPGKTRRTKAEIAEDEAAAKADAAKPMRYWHHPESSTVFESRENEEGAGDGMVVEVSREDYEKLAAAYRAASIKEDVLAGAAEQQAAYDSPEDAAQDAADEAAETAATKTGLTLDDLRHAAARYQKKFGMAAAVAGIPALLGCAMVDVPEADLAAAIAKIDAAVKGDAPGPVEDAAPAAAEKPATKEDVQAAMLRYALKFDGQTTDFNAMPKTMEDAPRIFTLLFGEGVVKLSQVPADGYARTVAAFDEAIEKDPFKRASK